MKRAILKTPAKTIVPQIDLDGRSPVPLQRQLYESLRRIVIQGELPPGVRLPATRALARSLGVSRNTVLFAYEELAADELVSGETGSGTRVGHHGAKAQFADPDGHVLYCRGPR